MRLPVPARLALATLTLSVSLTACVQPQTPDLALVTTLGFESFDAQQPTLKLRGGTPGGLLSRDAEPEYITVAPDGKTAYVTVQESNAVATLDLTTATWTGLKSLGLKDHSAVGMGLDASDRDGGINIQNWPVQGAYMPDAIASFSSGGQTYLLTANEGDTRDYAAFTDTIKVSDLKLDAATFPNAAALQQDAALGRLLVSRVDADVDGDGDADRLVSFGGRSMSVWTTDLTRVADTGDLFERKTAELTPSSFNSGGTNSTRDTRSDNKGPEPEGVTVGQVAGKTLAFVGLERTGGVMVLDVSTPAAPAFVAYANTVTPTAAPNSGLAGDLGPEGLLFIPAAESPSGKNMLVVANEVSGSTTLYSVADSGNLTLLGRHQVTPYSYDKGAAEIPAYDPASKRLFVVNGATGGLDMLSIADPVRPARVGTVDLSRYGASANSVTVKNGVVAVAVQDAVKTNPGKVAFLNSDGTERAPAVTVGALPDMLTFTPDGSLLLVANEGEPNDDYSIDPAGSVSLINVTKALQSR
ncbi:choice-of-anchor I family protein [Deinococcus aquatilis]|uniref:choice-of-anchor I family protein n=1 Tax=Deinococcus aquatilis TaxID=519440 RepID=UPI00035FCB41|nr:choice-of-anchor I family protein [Deinococcus aquatilis]